jgi:hypothetical protein
MCTERACPRDMTNELGNRCANPSCKATDEPRTKKFKRDPHNTPANYEQYQQCIQNGMGHSIDRIGTENEWKGLMPYFAPHCPSLAEDLLYT